MKKEKVVDMTRGSILRHLLLFSIPLIIGNVFQQLYSMVDTIIVGRTLGVDALAAVGASGSLVFFLVGFAIGLTGGFAIIVSQRFGAGDMEGVRRSTAMGAMLGIGFSVILTFIGVALSRRLLLILNTPEEILNEAQKYLNAIFWGIPLAMFYNYLSSVIRALGDSRTPLYFLLLASILNIILDFVCILNLHMGVMGAGVATVFSQGLSALLCLFYIGRKFPILHLKRSNWKFDWHFAWYHLRLGIPMAVQSSVIATGAMAIQASLNSYGAIAMAGYAAASRTEQLVSQVLISLGLTLATFVGQNYGAGSYARIREGVRKCTVITMTIAIIGAIMIILFGRTLTLFFIGTDAENAEQMVYYSRQYLSISACCYPILSCIFIFRNVMQGIGSTGIVLTGSVIELLCRLVGAFVLAAAFGYMGVCLAGPLAWLGAALLFVITYFLKMPKLKRQLS